MKKIKKAPANGKKNPELEHYNAILIENLQSEFRMVIEHADGVEERLTRRMDEKFALQDERFDRIESVLREHSRVLQMNEERWEENGRRWDKNEERWNQNEGRLDRIEGKLDGVIEKVDRHEIEILDLRKKIVNQ